MVSINTHAQGRKNTTGSYYGFEASAGIQSFEVGSNVAALNEAAIEQRGASIGLILGQDYWQLKLKPIGFYNSNSTSPNTVKLIETSGTLNIYPIKLLTGNPKSKFPQLYLSGGVTRGKYKISGSYLPEGQTSDCVYENETFSGSMRNINLTGGAGLEYQLQFDYGLITLFAEIKKGLSVSSSSNQDVLKNTALKNLTFIHVGMAIGINKK